MWPVLLDMTKEESMQSLRNLELEAYAHLVSALRAQGPLDSDKKRLLKDTSQLLNITQDRHKAEIRRAVNDEKLNTIAYHVTGLTESLDDWAQEGRRTVPLVPRATPQTAFSAIADEAAENAHLTNKQLPSPSTTERKRPVVAPPTPPLVVPQTSFAVTEAGPKTGVPFRVPEAPRGEECKKRKLLPSEGSSLAQHLLSAAGKVGRNQPIYSFLNRQRSKAPYLKDVSKTKTKLPFNPIVHTTPAIATSTITTSCTASNGPKINVVQNVVLTPPISAAPSFVNNTEETIEQIQNEINSYKVDTSQQPSCSNENQAPKPKLVTPTTKTQLNFKQIAPANSDNLKNLKMCQRKTVTSVTKAGSPLGQKLIVVSNAQTITNTNILQKSLSIPLVKNISVKNLEKFKIVTTSSPQVTSVNNSLKHKVVTVKANPSTKKVIPLSILNSKGGIKVLPIGGKIVSKTAGVTASSPPLYIVNTVKAPTSPKENGKSTILGDIMKASGVTNDDSENQVASTNHVEKVEAEIEADADVESHHEEIPEMKTEVSESVALAEVSDGN